LPELLEAQGYYTGAVVANPQVAPIFGFDRGFQFYDELYRKMENPLRPTNVDMTHSAEMVLERVQRFIERAPLGKPYFLYVLTIDPHGPHRAPPPFDKRYPPDDLTGGMTKADLEAQRASTVGARSHHEALAQYRGEVSYSDVLFGKFMDWMRAREDNPLDGTVVVLTSDHGEAFGEHGERGHGKTLHDEVLGIPLIVRFPKGINAGQRRSETVDHIDLSATLAAIGGAELPAHWTGRDLREELEPKAIISESYLEKAHQYTSVLLGGHKLIEDERVGNFQLYNLIEDPLEQNPIVGESRKIDALRAALTTHRTQSKRVRDELVGTGAVLDEGEMPDNIRKMLESLGYVDEGS
jgi:arylsulfatase